MKKLISSLVLAVAIAAGTVVAAVQPKLAAEFGTVRLRLKEGRLEL